MVVNYDYTPKVQKLPEEWKLVQGTNGRLKISNYGRYRTKVLSKTKVGEFIYETGEWSPPRYATNRGGYPQVRISIEGN